MSLLFSTDYSDEKHTHPRICCWRMPGAAGARGTESTSLSVCLRLSVCLPYCLSARQTDKRTARETVCLAVCVCLYLGLCLYLCRSVSGGHQGEVVCGRSLGLRFPPNNCADLRGCSCISRRTIERQTGKETETHNERQREAGTQSDRDREAERGRERECLQLVSLETERASGCRLFVWCWSKEVAE